MNDSFPDKSQEAEVAAETRRAQGSLSETVISWLGRSFARVGLVAFGLSAVAVLLLSFGLDGVVVAVKRHGVGRELLIASVPVLAILGVAVAIRIAHTRQSRS